ncbi:MAG: copper chaperone PCu(A)C [SAR202 cluster bacterium]|nr:copper chaperone PCu(A)C [SAR202 cluster bacterium]
MSHCNLKLVSMLALAALLALLLAACDEDEPSATPVPPTATAQPAAKIGVQGAWARPASTTSPSSMTPAASMTPGMMGSGTPGAMMGSPTAGMMGSGATSAVYMTIVNDGNKGDALVSARSDVATRTELHESKMVDNVMRMSPVELIEVPAGGKAELKQGASTSCSWT